MATTGRSICDGARPPTIRRRIRGVVAGVVSASTAALLIGPAASPAAARPWPDDPNRGVVVAGASASRPAWLAPLRRVGTQLVRADDLTGAGAVAPAWIPELQSLG